MATTKRTSLMARIRNGVSWIYFKLAGAQKRLVEEAWQEQVDAENAMLLRLASLEGLNYGEMADEAALIALDAIEGVVKDGGLATIEGVQGIYVYDLGAGSGDIEGSFGWWNLDIDGKVTLAQVLADLAAKGITGYRKVLAFVANEAALPAGPTLGDAYIQSDTGALRVCTAEAIVDPPTPAVWSTEAAGTVVFVVRNLDDSKTYFWNGAWTEIGTGGTDGYLAPVIAFFDPSGALPVGPSEGDRYIALATANGWTVRRVYEYNGATWDETIPGDSLVRTTSAAAGIYATQYPVGIYFHGANRGATGWWRLTTGAETAIVADTTALVALTGYLDGDEVVVLDLGNGMPGRVKMDIDNAGVAASLPSEYRTGVSLEPYDLYTPSDAGGGDKRWVVTQAMIPHEGIGYADIADFATGAASNQRTYIGSERSVSFRATALADGDTVEVDDGATAVTFEFDDGGGVGGGHTAVLIGASKLEAMTNLKTAINAAWAGPAPAVVVDLGGGDAELVMWGWTADLVLDATIAGGGAWTWMSPAKPDDGDGVPDMRVGLVLLDITDEMLAAPFSGAIRKYVGSASTSGWGACTDADDYPVIGIRAMAAAGTVKSVGDTAVTPVCVAGPGGTASLYLDIVLDGLAAGDMLVIEIGNYGL